MKFLKIRAARKELKDILHHAKHVRHMHEDIADAQHLSSLHELETAARKARCSGDPEQMQRAGEALRKACSIVAPVRPNHKMRENVEVIFVAIAAAMAIRAYFLQPFKIPTGSMQPTLYGITVRPQEPGEMDSIPEKVFGFFVKGEMLLQDMSPFAHVLKTVFIGPGMTVRARASGTIRTHRTADGIGLDYRDNFDSGSITIFIGDVPHNVPKNLVQFCRFGEYIRAGESVVKGVAKAGDYILVNRVEYNFSPPDRGDIVVFDARDVTRNAYYIKRLVGLPNETISVDPPYLLVNGEKAIDPRFEKIFNKDGDYSGYVFGDPLQAKIVRTGDSITTGPDEFLFFGDNSPNSLDGRYFGGVKRERVLGSAFFVGLPLDRAGLPEIWH